MYAINIFLLSWYIYAFLIHAFYDCNLRAYMMFVDREPAIDTAQDMIDQVCNMFINSQKANMLLLGTTIVVSRRVPWV